MKCLPVLGLTLENYYHVTQNYKKGSINLKEQLGFVPSLPKQELSVGWVIAQEGYWGKQRHNQ